MAELPDMDELLRSSDRRERRTSLQLGLMLVVGGVAVFLGTRSLFDGQLTWVAPATIVIGLGLIGRGLFAR